MKRILAVIMTLCILCGSLPVSAQELTAQENMAASGEQSQIKENISEESDTVSGGNVKGETEEAILPETTEKEIITVRETGELVQNGALVDIYVPDDSVPVLHASSLYSWGPVLRKQQYDRCGEASGHS